MSLDLRNFINININYNTVYVSSVARGIVTLITKSTNYSTDPYKNIIFYSLDDYLKSKKELEIEDDSLDIFVKAFFANQGKGLQIVGGYVSGSISEFIIGVLKTLDYKFTIIVSDADEEDLRIASVSTAQTNIAVDPYDNTEENPTVSTFSGLNEKMFISSTTDHSGKIYNKLTEAETFTENKYYEFNATTGQYDLLTSEPADFTSNYSSYFKEGEFKPNNYVLKVGKKGIEMLAAAYLSRVRISDGSTIQDYAFTIENLGPYDNDLDLSSSLISDNNIGVELIKNHFNFDTKLVNAIRNCPGDTLSGIDMMNYYVKILLTQDLTEAVMDLLVSKIRFNQAGINRLNNVISQRMNAYIDNGYLNTDYIWTDEDLVYTFNGVEYMVCPRNTPLVKGYRCVILPLTSLTSVQKEAHVLPPVYLLLADQTGIRVIVINGDVF